VKVDGQTSRAYGSKELKSRLTREDNNGQGPASNKDKPEREKSLHGYSRSNTGTSRRGDGGSGTGLSGQMSKNMAVSIIMEESGCSMNLFLLFFARIWMSGRRGSLPLKTEQPKWQTMQPHMQTCVLS